MTEQVDFYILSDASANGRLHYACRLAEKAYDLGHSIFIFAPQDANVIDDMLWSFKQNSFVPHALQPWPDDEIAPIRIGISDEQPWQADILINLALEVPGFFTDFKRLIEVVDQHEQVLKSSRQRFKFYREQGLEPKTHKL